MTLSVRSADACAKENTTLRQVGAITTMLSLGVHEQLVRKISGHTPHSKEFYRYVSWSQTLQDRSTEEMFAKLEQKKLVYA